MARVTADRIKETTTTAGTGTITLGGSSAGFKAFSSICAVGDTCYYCISDNNSLWEVGLGTYGTGVLSRVAGDVLSGSSGSGVLVSFGTGAKDVFITAPASRLIQSDINGDINANVNLRSGTQAALQSLAGGATEIALATDTRNLVRVNGLGDTFYKGEAHVQLGLSKKMGNNDGLNIVYGLAGDSVLAGGDSTYIGNVGYPSLGANGTNLLRAMAIGNSASCAADDSSAIGYSVSANTRGSTVIGANNAYGGLFQSGVALASRHNLNNSPMGVKGFNTLAATTTGTVAANLTTDGLALQLPLAAPPAPTFGTTLGTLGVFPTGTYGLYVSLENDHGEVISDTSSSIAITLGQRIVVNRPTVTTGATHWRVYVTDPASGTPTFYQKNTVAYATAIIGQNPIISTNSWPPFGSYTTNGLHSAGGQLLAFIMNATFKIMVRDTTTENVSTFTRQVVIAADSAGTLTMKTAAGGNTIGVDYLGITPLVAASIAFSVDNVNKLLKLTVTPTAGTANTLQWHAAFDHDVVYA